MRTLLVLIVIVIVTAGWAMAQDSGPQAATPRKLYVRGTVREVLEWKAEDVEDGDEAGEQRGKSSDEKVPELPPFVMKQSGRKKLTKKRLLRVEPGPDTRLIVHTVETLGDLEDGDMVWVLGRYQGPTRAPGGTTVPAQIIQIQVVVSGYGFVPPSLSPAARAGKLSWQSGTLQRRDKNHFSLDSVNMQVGSERKVVVASDGDPLDLGKKAKVIVAGELDKKSDPPVLHADVIIFPTRRIRAEEYAHVVGQ